jgi:lysophospholipase L1-like esterase
VPLELPARVSDRLARPVGPRRFVRQPRDEFRAPVVVCAGDSITHGIMSANYVALLHRRLAQHGFNVVNAGVNGQLVYNLNLRLDEVLACEPDVVTVLIGTNDVAAHIDGNWCAAYMKQQKLPRRPDLEWYVDQLSDIVARLQRLTTARIALLDLPPLGEDLDSPHNRRLCRYNIEIHELGRAAGIPVLPLHARLVASLLNSGQALEFDGSKALMVKAILRHHVLRTSYDEVATRHGLHLLTDHVHLTDRAAGMVADLIEEFVHAETRGSP